MQFYHIVKMAGVKNIFDARCLVNF